MNNQHPITPPPELLQEWYQQERNCNSGLDALKDLATQAARWGADQELEACCELLKADGYKGKAIDLRAARRPKPPTLKEQALANLLEIYTSQPFPVGDSRFNCIRRALEALPE
jgi:hypothetical protein